MNSDTQPDLRRALFGSRTCPECGRVFDLTNAVDAEESAYGHDCEEARTMKLVPVNAPSEYAAREAVRDLLARERRPFRVVGARVSQAGQMADDKVAIVVTNPGGPRSTFHVEIEKVRA